jgi:4-amino-4-deoxychorismate lyase
MSDSLGTWIDGTPTDLLPADDRALQYGDGLFETLLVRGRRPRFLEAHLARLTRGCERLRIPFERMPELRAEIAAACRQAPALAVLKIIVSRGSALRRGYAPDDAAKPRRLLSLWDTVALSAEQRDGAELVLSSVTASEQPLLAGIKHLNRLENVLAAREAREAQAFDALLRTADGRLVSGAMSNLFLVNAGAIFTPPVDRAGVAGVLRGVVLRECQALDIEAAERDLTQEDLRSADEVFVTNARIGVVPVRRVGQHHYSMSPLSRRLASHIEALDA